MTSQTEAQPPQLPGLSYVRRLGRGGNAEVFLYEQAHPRMRVAVKILSGEGLTEQTRERFAAEANAMAELADHPNIVQVFRTDITEDGRPYLVMKYYPQRNLAVRSRMERLSVPEVLKIGVRIASAVETAHRAGIFHRDIKPANILTSQYGEPGLTDFGIATTIAGEGASDAEGMSVPWAPPEVLFGTSPGGRSADVYALGATLWHLLAGLSPFEIPGGDNMSLALMRRIREKAPQRTGRDDVPASFERLLAQAMAKNPADRPQSALQLARALQEIETEQRLAATPLVLLDGQPDEYDPTGWAPDQPQTPGSEPGSETRFRTPQTLRPQTLQRVGEPVDSDREKATVRRSVVFANTPQPAATGAPSRPQRMRQGMPGTPDEPRTVRRATSLADEPTDNDPAPVAAHRHNPWKLAAASAAAVAAMIGIGLTLAGHGSGASSPTASGTAPTLPVLVAPADPTVSAVRVDADQVKFSWSETDPQPGDDFEWQREGATQWTPAASDSVTLDDPSYGQVCIVVEVGRDDNTETAQSTKCFLG